MTGFRILLVLMFTTLLLYTTLVVLDSGVNFVTPFVGNIFDVGWQGQFNLDFMMLIMVTSLWIAWRHKFSLNGIAVALIWPVAGLMFLSMYLLVASYRANGNVSRMLLGDQVNEP